MPGIPPPTGQTTGIVTRSEWVTSLASALGNQAPSTNILLFLEAWTKQEGGSFTNKCQFNLLNSMQETQTSTQCPNAKQGIQAYSDINDSIAATATALQNGLYPSLLHALRTNDENNLGFNGHTIAPNVASDLSVWATGSSFPISWNYVNAIVSISHDPTQTGGADTTSTAGNNTTTGGSSGAYPGLVRIGIGAIGIIMMLAGVSLLLKELAPGPVKAVKGLLA